MDLAKQLGLQFLVTLDPHSLKNPVRLSAELNILHKDLSTMAVEPVEGNFPNFIRREFIAAAQNSDGKKFVKQVNLQHFDYRNLLQRPGILSGIKRLEHISKIPLL